MSAELSNEDLPALFWDSLPENAEEHPDYVALQALAEESTPEERAQNFKEQGNNKLRIGLKAKNRVLLREAVDFYSKGLQLKCSDSVLNSVLLSNRAHVESLLGNWRKALEDSVSATAYDPTNLKAFYRGARAALKVGDVAKCKKLCAEGLKLDPGAAEMLQLQQKATEEEAKLQQQREKEQQQLEERRQAAETLVDAITAAGYRMTQAQVRVGQQKPYLDGGGVLHWPVLLVYPETMQQDVIEDFDVRDAIADHLDVMFAPDAPPLEWDGSGEYSRHTVELYYLSNAGRQLSKEEMVDTFMGEGTESGKDQGPTKYGDKAACWVRVDESSTLDAILQHTDFLIPGAPMFFVVAKGTEYRRRFLSEGSK